MKTKHSLLMKDVLAAGLALFSLMASVDANAWGWNETMQAMRVSLHGNPAWHGEGNSDGEGIAQEFLSGKIVYARTKPNYSYAVTEKVLQDLCGPNESSKYGKRLFDPEPSFCTNPNAVDNYAIVRFTFDSGVATWNYYSLLLPKTVADAIEDKILKVQMGNTITREPPQLLGVLDKTDACKDDGPLLPAGNNKIICNDWTWEALHNQYWGKEVPPELKALNGSAVKKAD
ncbi:hypothetical protein ICN48_06515 [Polynucleobacter sp. JS-Safj-400b-B2]|uniref:hypothetical protein n=1 Tax=Polynucleobacter sp. JS-Safj-400b-B2 TaxID=2576921 RepID=UPI001C0D5936|nr:hypothetical protein [Polynucleobacter sp. JS-Safj-400b-B2]MBU3625886.1 hypothetical protein [Polynucleobacter sp. JS-Safj-400b-B2]